MLCIIYRSELSGESSNSTRDEVEIDPEQIKGDAIGDTVYSERYVLKILIQLSQVGEEVLFL